MVELYHNIVDKCRQGNRKAQIQLYTTFSKRVYNSCYRILRNIEDAEDAMQESFLKVFSNLEKYPENIPFEAWITRIAINTAIDKFRKKEIEFTDWDDSISPHTESDEDDREELSEQVGLVKKSIEKLPESSRLIITLYLIEGYDHEEIAEILKVQSGTVRIQYMRAKQKLLDIIKNS